VEHQPAPGRDEAVPDAHGVHALTLVAPVELQNVPAAQAVHAVAPVAPE